jgi:hypothetical protein
MSGLTPALLYKVLRQRDESLVRSGILFDLLRELTQVGLLKIRHTLSVEEGLRLRGKFSERTLELISPFFAVRECSTNNHTVSENATEDTKNSRFASR